MRYLSVKSCRKTAFYTKLPRDMSKSYRVLTELFIIRQNTTIYCHILRHPPPYSSLPWGIVSNFVKHNIIMGYFHTFSFIFTHYHFIYTIITHFHTLSHIITIIVLFPQILSNKLSLPQVIATIREIPQYIANIHSSPQVMGVVDIICRITADNKR